MDSKLVDFLNLCDRCLSWMIREGAMVMRCVCGQTLKLIIKNLLSLPEIHVKMVCPPLKHIKNGLVGVGRWTHTQTQKCTYPDPWCTYPRKYYTYPVVTQWDISVSNISWSGVEVGRNTTAPGRMQYLGKTPIPWNIFNGGPPLPNK